MHILVQRDHKDQQYYHTTFYDWLCITTDTCHKIEIKVIKVAIKNHAFINF